LAAKNTKTASQMVRMSRLREPKTYRRRTALQRLKNTWAQAAKAIGPRMPATRLNQAPSVKKAGQFWQMSTELSSRPWWSMYRTTPKWV
jgi:hypothetical protein